MSEKLELDVGVILDDGAWTSFQKRVLALVAAIIFLDGFDTQTLTLAMPRIAQEWRIGSGDFGPVLALGFLSMAAGTFLGGAIADRYGRRPALLISVFLFGVGTCLGFVCQNVLQLGATRILASAGLGAAMPNATALIAEYTPLRRRALAISLVMGCVPVGAFVGGFVAAAVLPGLGWRVLFLISGLIPLAALIVLYKMLPESLRFLIQAGSADTLIQRTLARMNIVVPAGSRFVDLRENTKHATNWRAIFVRPYLRSTLALSLAFFFVIFANILVLSWSPSLFALSGYDLATTSRAAALFSIGGLIGGIGGSFLLRRAGPRIGLLVMIAAACALLLLMARMQLSPAQTSTTMLLAAMLIGGTFVPGSQVLLFGLTSAVYPTSIRGAGIGMTAAAGRLGAVMSGLVGAGVIAGGAFSFFGVAALAMAAAGLSLACMGRETSTIGGRSRTGAERTTA